MRGERLVVQVERLLAVPEPPQFLAGHQIHPKVRRARVDVKRGGRGVGAYEQTRPGLLVPDPRNSLEVISGEVLWHGELGVRRWAEDARAVTVQRPVVEVPRAKRVVVLNLPSEIIQRHSSGVDQAAPVRGRGGLGV